ncbi:hypothetical protein BDM02DRAFT_3100221 [Thelephora ganbajun]|uniref:Uncharacterized protein n=1 Tax=Thelephora ganbajun TaxID=370292 RepID=A0ACB6Z9N4_THEGA|nr:hypothetical protein BDM02DRAFT_3100221 [Thelephora ganbajun]
MTGVKRSLRIFALPLSRQSVTGTSTGTGKARAVLNTYYHFVTSLPSDVDQGNPSLISRATDKVASIWANWGKAKPGTWRIKVFNYGERLVDRLDFEELALKSLDPSLGPKITSPRTIPLLYPQHVITSPLLNLQTLVDKRAPRHKRGAWFWLLVSPLTAPFMLIPIIPNLPFFFCIWRSWHHFRAYKASQYLQDLLTRGAISPQSDPQLDQIYSSSSVSTTSNPQEAATPETHEPESSDANAMLLSTGDVPRIQHTFKLPKPFATDLYRALAQTSSRIEKHREEAAALGKKS